MTLPQFAGSFLLVLTLASLSALAPPSPRGTLSVSGQSLGRVPASASDGVDARLALAESRAPGTRVGQPAWRAAPGIIPPAGEIVPGAGQ
jgi:hypothetical protein